MKKRLLWLLGGVFIFLQASVGAALAYDVTGTIHNGTNNSTSRVYVVVMYSGESNSTGFGTSFASIPAGGSTAFTIRGVPNGTYQVAAFMDLSNTGSLHLYDPSVISSSFGIDNANPPNVGTLDLPAIIASPPAPTAPEEINVVTTSNGALVMWNGPQGQVGGTGPNAEIADSYVIYWGSSPNPSNPVQSKTVPASGDYHVFVSPLTQGTSVYFAVKAINRGGSATTATPGSFLIQGGTTGPGTATVSGRVYSTGITKPGAPLYIVLIPDNGFPYITGIPAPVPDSAPWSIDGVAPGTYNIYVILDLNNDGFSNVAGYATGRGVNDGYHNAPSVMVPSGASTATAPDVTVTAPNSGTIVNTMYNQGNTFNPYQLQFKVMPMLKRPVSVTINNSGPNMNGAPIDLGIAVGNNGGGNASRYGDNSGPQVSFSAKPTVGDTYSVTVGYSDGSSETVHPQVTGVVSALPSLNFPSGTVTTITNPAPFAWLTPGNLAGYYDFSLYLTTNSPFYNRIWAPQENGDGGGMPATQLSIPYNSDNSASQSTLDPGTAYSWSVTVSDGFGNQGFGQAIFTPQAGGPVISGFAPASGAVGPGGTPVTISGSGFTGATAVKFGGFLAIPFTVVNDGQITTTVPAAASVGPITVTVGGVTTASSTSFQPTISFKGGVADNGGAAINGATVTLVNSNPVVTTNTNAGGDFNITVPAGVPYSLLIHKAGYFDILTATMSNPSNQDSSSTGSNPSPYKLYLSNGSELPSGVSGTMAIKGLIYTRLRDWDKTSANLDFSGATVTATSFLHPGTPYTVQYPSGSSTGSDGYFYVPNVDEGDTVGVTATLPGYFTLPRTYVTHTGVVSAGKVNATPVPVVTATPSGGTIYQPISLALSNTVGWNSYSIWYTTDGSDPTVSGGTRMLYSSPIPLSPGSKTLKFYAVNTTHNVPGSVVTASYNVITVPGAPTGVSAAAGNGQATVIFTAPVSNGGSAITGYTVTSSPAGGVDSNAGTTGLSHIITGLANGTDYTFTVTATNAAGTGPASSPASNGVMPYYILSVIISGTGTGSVNSIPSGIACSSGSPAGCSANFSGSPTPSVSLSATPDWKSLAGSWGADCTGTGACSVLMDINRGVTISFTPNLQAELMPVGTPFASLQDAYYAAAGGNTTIKAHVYTFLESLLLNNPIAVTLDGGKDSGYSTTVGLTTLHGILTVAQGALTASYLIIQ